MDCREDVSACMIGLLVARQHLSSCTTDYRHIGTDNHDYPTLSWLVSFRP